VSPPLTVLVPVYNEEKTVAALIRRVIAAPYPDKQIVVIDDGSMDGTAATLRQWEADTRVLILRHPTNRGKGAAVRTGLALATGSVTLIQDADLEYDPADYPLLVEPILLDESAVVYGSRYLVPTRLPWTRYRVGGAFLNVLVRLLYGRHLSDEATCYKAAPTWLWKALDLRAERFELCAEMTAKVCRLGLPIQEVPIHYAPRTVDDGKKIGWKDVWPTVRTLVQWRFRSFRLADQILRAKTVRKPRMPARP
jgi:dolichol-phosphate mannosyltransferase